MAPRAQRLPQGLRARWRRWAVSGAGNGERGWEAGIRPSEGTPGPGGGNRGRVEAAGAFGWALTRLGGGAPGLGPGGSRPPGAVSRGWAFPRYPAWPGADFSRALLAGLGLARYGVLALR